MAEFRRGLALVEASGAGGVLAAMAMTVSQQRCDNWKDRGSCPP